MSDELKQTILVVDDAPENISVIKGLLGEKYKLKAALDGERALKIAAKGVDLILLDIQMPSMNGFEVCEQLKVDPATTGIPVIFLSGEEDPASAERARSLGAVAYVTKPVDPAQLIQAVSDQLQ